MTASFILHSIRSAATFTASTSGTGLPKYDAACRALAEAKSVDEVKHIHDWAGKMQAYAKQARNRSVEADAAAIGERVERRLGQMIAAQPAPTYSLQRMPCR
jgi:hypothetical protein